MIFISCNFMRQNDSLVESFEYHQNPFYIRSIMFTKKPSKVYLVAGTFLLIIGLIWFLHAVGLHIPEAVISFQSAITLIGLLTLVQTQFKSETAWIIFAVGNVLLSDKISPDHNIIEIGFSSILFIFGGYLLFKYYWGNKKIEEDSTVKSE